MVNTVKEARENKEYMPHLEKAILAESTVPVDVYDFAYKIIKSGESMPYGDFQAES